MTIFAEQLKKLRTEKKLSQDALAEKLFSSRQSIFAVADCWQRAYSTSCQTNQPCGGATTKS